jgi:hypothetical protein
MKTKPSERGQALVLLVLAMVGLLGFTALALDGGMVYTDRRQAQNAADTAALAAALARSDNRDWQAAGMTQAGLYGYNDDGVKSLVDVYNPPHHGLYAPPFANSSQYFQVVITSTLDSSFAHFVFSGSLRNTVEAVARVRPPSSIFPGNALHATNETACKAVWFAGNGQIDIHGGNIFSNSTADGHPTSCHAGVKSGSAGDITVTGGGILTAGTFRNQSGVVITTDDGVHEGVEQQQLPAVPLPDCSGLATRSYSGGDATLQPGWYPGGIRVTGAHTTLVLNPGMYCLGNSFTANGGSITGNGIMIYQHAGEFDLGGNTTVNLTRSSNLVDASNNQWAGMLFYMPPDNTSLVNINGNGASSYTGTFYAPGPASPASQAKCTISGTGDSLGLNSQVICNTVKVTGDAHLYINFQEEENFRLPPLIDLVQ